MTQPATSNKTQTVTIWASVVIAVVLVIAAVLLGIAGWQSEAIVGLLTSIGTVAAFVIAALSKVFTVDQKQDAQTVALATITKQTNGVLDARVQAAVMAAMDARDAAANAPSGAADPEPVAGS